MDSRERGYFLIVIFVGRAAHVMVVPAVGRACMGFVCAPKGAP
jgi:hypothetical protein